MGKIAGQQIGIAQAGDGIAAATHQHIANGHRIEIHIARSRHGINAFAIHTETFQYIDVVAFYDFGFGGFRSGVYVFNRIINIVRACATYVGIGDAAVRVNHSIAADDVLHIVLHHLYLLFGRGAA